MDEIEKAFRDIKELLISPQVVKAPTLDGLFCLESDTSSEGVGGTLFQKQGDEGLLLVIILKNYQPQPRISE